MRPEKKSSYIKKLLVGIGIVFLLVIVFSAGLVYGLLEANNGAKNNTLIQEVIGNFNNNTVEKNLFTRVWQTVKNEYVYKPVNQETAFYGALKGMVSSLGDPYSTFFDPSETKNFNNELSGSFEGIGAEIGIKNSELTVIAPLPGSPAEKSGLKSGDKILTIDKQETTSLSLDKAISLIRGPKNSVVILTIIPVNEQEIKSVSITRDVISVKSVTWSLKDGIAVIVINHFNSDTTSEFNSITKEIVLKNPKGLILDLRDNPGGYLDSSVDIAGQFLDHQVIVIEDYGTTQKKYSSNSTASLKEFPLVVLVNKGSASASEILAGALQDYKHGTIVGETTFGKGSVQDYEQYADGSSLKLTVAKWLTPLGNSIDEKGITPDVQVSLSSEDYNSNRDPQLDKALELLK